MERKVKGVGDTEERRDTEEKGKAGEKWQGWSICLHPVLHSLKSQKSAC